VKIKSFRCRLAAETIFLYKILIKKYFSSVLQKMKTKSDIQFIEINAKILYKNVKNMFLNNIFSL